MSGHTLYIVWS